MAAQGEASPESPLRRVLVGSVGDCVHSLGVESFAEWLQDQDLGYMPVKLGPAVPVHDIVNKVREARPEVVGISIRLGDLHVDRLVGEFIDECRRHGLHPKESGIRYCFGGLRPAANLVRAMTGLPVLPDKFSPEDERHYDLDEVAAQYAGREGYQGFFDLIADDYITMEELQRFARRRATAGHHDVAWADDLKPRIAQVRELENRPILRAHLGIAAETVEPTIKDVEMVAEAGALEIVSLGPDQPSQAHLAKFIRGEEDPSRYLCGQGGVPIRAREDLERLKEATRRGNHPTIRIYSGTDELLELARLFEDTLHMPFPAVPVFFYNQLDGRGPIAIREGFDEHFDVIRWWAARQKPLEINDPHQWQLRNSSDDMYVADHVLAAVIALKLGIKDYIMQLMFDLPPGISPLNDLAKMKAAAELIEPLARHFDYNVIKETRGGLSSFPPNLDMAKGHLAVSTYWQLFMQPDIVHVVSFPEAHHEAKGADVIESCDIVRQVIRDFKAGEQPDVFHDPRLVARKEELKRGAMYNILHLALLGGYEGRVPIRGFRKWAVPPEVADRRHDPEARKKNLETMILDLIDEANYPARTCGLVSGDTLDLALQVGLFQAPKLTVVDKRYELVGKCRTRIIDGACRAQEFCGRPVRDEMHRVDLVRRRAPWFFDKSVSTADDRSFISELPEEIDQGTVDGYRRRLGVGGDLGGNKVLVVDFGSTFTKLGFFDTDDDDRFELHYVPTTPDDLRQGLADGLGVLSECRRRGDWEPLAAAMSRFDIKLPCSSAKGGLKVVTAALVAEESGEALNIAALTAGAKLLASYAGPLSDDDARRIYTEDRPEIIMLAGGVDGGGDTATQAHNARVLARHAHLADYARYGIPVIYSGNQDVAQEVAAVLAESGIDVRVTPNVMPEVNTYNIEAVNEVLRELFQTVIIRGKGFDVVEEYMSARFIPTPRAAFLGINLLARGYGSEAGLGNLMALDIGGCTTDFYVNVGANPLYTYTGDDQRRRVKRTILKTPNAPLAYRRVEGKFGLSYNAENLTELERFSRGDMGRELDRGFNALFPRHRPGRDEFSGFVSGVAGARHIDLGAYLQWLSRHPRHLPRTVAETWVTSFLASEIVRLATRNNVGSVRETDTYFLQHGVNLYNMDCTSLLIGGTIYHKCRDGGAEHLRDLKWIARGALYDPADEAVLRPRGPVLMDADYLVSTVGGLYGRIDPERALRLMKRHLRRLVDGPGELTDDELLRPTPRGRALRRAASQP